MKKEYTSPKLVEYGNMEDLTKAGEVELSADMGTNYMTGWPTCGDPPKADLF